MPYSIRGFVFDETSLLKISAEKMSLGGNLRARLVPFAAGAAGGVLGMYLYQAMPVALPSNQHPALRFGVPQTSSTRFFSNFVSEVDYSTRNPKWVLEHLDEAQTSSRAASRKSARYYEDEEIDPRFRSRLSQYVSVCSLRLPLGADYYYSRSSIGTGSQGLIGGT
jgi:hypothetical protein